jgi:uncharacterized protein (TIGR03437 family)
MKRQVVLAAALAAITFYPLLLLAQNPAEFDVLLGTSLASGLDLGINTSGGLTNWLTPQPPPPTLGDLSMVCPGGQLWCAMFITDGPAVSTYPRLGIDVSGYKTMIVEIEGDAGTTIQIGIKDATQPDDGTETKVTLPVTSNWTAFAIPLSSFLTPVPAHTYNNVLYPTHVVDLTKIYVPSELVFAGGPQPQAVKVRTILYTTTVTPTPSSMQSAASFLTGAGSNTWVSIFGQNLSPITRGWLSSDFQQNNLPTTLGGTGVTVFGQGMFNGEAMPVSYVSPGQINALIRSDVPAGTAYVSITTPTSVSALLENVVDSVPVLVNVQALFPGLFTLSPPNAKYAAAIGSSDGAFIAPSGSLGAGVNARPAIPGETIELYGTGFGPTNPPDTPGMLLPSALPLVATPQVLFGNTPSQSVSFAGLVGPGLYQFNVVVPNVSAGDQQIVIRVGNSASQSNVFVPVKAGP